MQAIRPPRIRRLAAALGWAGLALAAALLLGLPALGVLALQDTAVVAPQQAPQPLDIQRAIRLMQAHDPRGKLPGISRNLALNERDLSLLAHFASNRLLPARARVQLHAGRAQLQVSLPVPASRLGQWLNLDLQLLDRPGRLPALDTLHVGRLRLPAVLVQALLPGLVRALELQPQIELARHLVSQINFLPGQMSLAYAWPDDLLRSLTAGLLPAEEQARVHVYTDLLQQLVPDLVAAGAPVARPARIAPAAQAMGLRPAQVAGRAASGPGEVSMAQLMAPVFALARQRSTDSASAALENRAALTALALVVNTLPTAPQRAGGTAGKPAGPASAANVTLMGRPDTPLHFLISAALSAKGGAALADAVGLYKELSDSRGGSGFSFNDLAADRAGTRLGQLAMRDPLAFQSRLAAGVQEDDLLPWVADLPDALSNREFLRRYGGVGAPAYRLMVQDIEARLDQKSLLSTAP